MSSVIRVDDTVLAYIQQQSRVNENPNAVLRRLLGITQQEEVATPKDSIVIVINAAGSQPNRQNADYCRRLTHHRIQSGVDILAPGRYADALRVLKPKTRIVMHQGGGAPYQRAFGAGQVIAAGWVREQPRLITPQDYEDFTEDFALTSECYPGKALQGILFYEFRVGIAPKPLLKEELGYRPSRGDNFIVIAPDDPRYPLLDEWWRSYSRKRSIEELVQDGALQWAGKKWSKLPEPIKLEGKPLSEYVLEGRE